MFKAKRVRKKAVGNHLEVTNNLLETHPQEEVNVAHFAGLEVSQAINFLLKGGMQRFAHIQHCQLLGELPFYDNDEDKPGVNRKLQRQRLLKSYSKLQGLA